MGKGRAKGRTKAKKSALPKSAQLVAGKRVRVESGIWSGEWGKLLNHDGAMALVKLDCKDVAQAIEVERLAHA